ncbi:MAG: hypothetical protein WCF65_05325 [Parachlamydiaceae bacterium]
MKLSHSKLITLSGLVWFAIGVYLLQLGLTLIFGNFHMPAELFQHHLPFIHALMGYIGGKEIAAILLVIIALYAGYLKGRYVLGKSAQRGIDRIGTLPNPSHIKTIYAPAYYLLLGGMVVLGISIKYMGLSNDVRGLIDVIIGSALINGAMIYFRAARENKAQA